jgi:hypothetical protein
MREQLSGVYAAARNRHPEQATTSAGNMVMVVVVLKARAKRMKIKSRTGLLSLKNFAQQDIRHRSPHLESLFSPALVRFLPHLVTPKTRHTLVSPSNKLHALGPREPPRGQRSQFAFVSERGSVGHCLEEVVRWCP